MKKCPLCRNLKAENDFMGIYCDRCDKLAAEVDMEWDIEFRPKNNISLT